MNWLDASNFVSALAQARVPHEDVKWFQRKRADRRRLHEVLTESERIRDEDYPINEEK